MSVTSRRFSSRGFLRDDVIVLLEELESRLLARGVQLDVQIVGAAALLLHGLLDRATGDIDAQYENAALVDEVVQEMADDHGLPDRWLNSNAVAYLPNKASWMAGPPGSSSAVRLADLHSLAAMKLAAERQKDIEDLGRIARALGIEDPEELVDIAYSKYGEDSMPLAARRDNHLIVAEEAIHAVQGQP
ncbi:DUF6036 family nucleotidyltransferase [Arthrobacter zhaoguopingii]|uniref:DUF6036 family nucleotidyltransferase n=1 Tax=Arthrobacter zhaoguopingii TaxID=2681491 RepID=UPI001FED576C|nr:DUF6036 family nucleotidyltransferase [Arthrobacter zhaoguopingii]